MLAVVVVIVVLVLMIWWISYIYSKNTLQGLGRIACIGMMLGIVWGIHMVLLIQLVLCHFGILPQFLFTDVSNGIVFIQWCTYIVCLCTFHLLEFYITAVYNPTQATADSFLINHSISYTTAAILSWAEFWIRCTLLRHIPMCSFPTSISMIGFMIVVLAQIIRSVAMATAGESFNHYIQTSKKQNHILITHGIYRVLRHPSYVGFFYWSIGTQLLLGNIIHTILYTMASWTFFQRRIHYEEESLCQFFPDTYPLYIDQSYIGIPFITSQIDRSKLLSKSHMIK